MHEPADPVTERIRSTAGLAPLVEEAEAVWRSRMDADGTGPGEGVIDPLPGWRPFEDAFPTFYQFTNRPPR